MAHTTIKALVQHVDPDPEDVPLYCFSNGMNFYNDNVPYDDTVPSLPITDGYGDQITDGEGGYIEYGDSDIASALEIKIFEFSLVSSQYFFGTVKTTSASDYVTFYWGDGTSESFSGTSNQYVSHDYESVGSHDVKIYATGGASVLTSFSFTYDAVISFALSDLPSGITDLEVTGYNTVSGDLSDLPSAIESVVIKGANTVSGNVSSIPSTATTVDIEGDNTVYGTISGLPSGIVALILSGDNVLGGDVGDIPSTCLIFDVSGLNSISDYTSSSWTPESFYHLNIVPVSGGLSAAEVDQLLIDIDSTVTSWSGSKYITLTGTNEARTSSSDAAVTSLEGKAVDVTTN